MDGFDLSISWFKLFSPTKYHYELKAKWTRNSTQVVNFGKLLLNVSSFHCLLQLPVIWSTKKLYHATVSKVGQMHVQCLLYDTNKSSVSFFTLTSYCNPEMTWAGPEQTTLLINDFSVNFLRYALLVRPYLIVDGIGLFSISYFEK